MSQSCLSLTFNELAALWRAWPMSQLCLSEATAYVSIAQASSLPLGKS